MANIVKKVLEAIPVVPFTSFLGLGKITTVQFLWVALVTAVLAMLVLLVTHSFSQQVLYWGVPLLATAMFLFIVGVVTCSLYMLKTFPQAEEVVIDKIVALLVVLAFSIPALMAVGNWVSAFMEALCSSFFVCSSGLQHFVAFVVVLPIPFILFYYFYEWHIWPKEWIDKHMRNGIGIMLDDIVISFYVIFMLYVVLFIPFKINPVVTGQYFAYVWNGAITMLKGQF